MWQSAASLFLSFCHPALAMRDKATLLLLGKEKICSAEDLKSRNHNIQIGKIRGVAWIKKTYGRKKNCEGEMRKISVLLTLQVSSVGGTCGFPVPSAWQLSVQK